MSKPRREMSPRRTAKSIRTHEKTMDAYSNATGWNRMSSKAFDDADKDKVAFSKKNGGDFGSIFPSAKRGDRPNGDIISPKNYNPRSKAEFKAILDSDSERSRIGHTLGKGHVSIKAAKTINPHTKDHPGHYWAKSTSEHAKAECVGCGATNRINTAQELNDNQVGWK